MYSFYEKECPPMHVKDIVAAQNPWWRDSHYRVAKGYSYRRELQPRLLKRLTQLGQHRALVLLGPRQVGKTTMLLQVVDDLLDQDWPAANLTYFDFSDHRVTSSITAQEVVAIEPEGLNPDRPRIFLLDEVASVPNWDRWLKGAVDRRVGRIVATDSAASLLREKGRESGLGRWDELRLEGLTFRELTAFSLPPKSKDNGLSLAPRLLEPYLLRGGFPEHAAGLLENRPGEDQIVLRTLRDDVVDRALLRDLAREVEDPEPLRKLFVYLVQASGSILNVAKRANDLQHDPRTVSRWVKLLKETLMLAELPRYARHPAAGLRSKPKIFAADHGLVNALALLDPQDSQVRGRVFETVVFRHLREVTQQDPEVRLSYFYDGKTLEGDFIVQHPSATIAVEVTSSAQPSPKQHRRVRKIAEKTQAGRRLLIFGGSVQQRRDEIELVPLLRFLWDPRKELGL